MCGIAGVWNKEWTNGDEIVSNMISSLAHRGPDGTGYLTEPQISLGHSRLAIMVQNNVENKITLIDRPLVSVLMSVFNERPVFLEKAVQSILNQTFSDVEFVIMDDGSENEATICTLNDLAQRDPRIRLCMEPHRGLTKMLNIGLSRCKGNLICRQDSDDWSEPDRIEKQVKFMAQHPEIGLVGSNCMLHQENGNMLWPSNLPLHPDDIMNAFYRMNPYCHGSACFRKSYADAIGGYREFCTVAQDYDFFWRISEYSAGSNLLECLYHHRRTAGSITTKRTKDKFIIPAVIRELAKMRAEGIPEDIEAAKNKAEKIVNRIDIGQVAKLKQGDHLLLAGHYYKSMRSYLQSVIEKPFSIRSYLRLVRLSFFIMLPLIRQKLFR